MYERKQKDKEGFYDLEICLPPTLSNLQKMRSSYKTRKEVSRFKYVNKILCITKETTSLRSIALLP
jgi:hypothetical protein